MKERDDSKPLRGNIQIDDVYWGGEKHGGKRGRGAAGKTPFVAAVQTNEKGDPIAMKMTRVDGFKKDAIFNWAQQHVTAGSHVHPMDYLALEPLKQLEAALKLL